MRKSIEAMKHITAAHGSTILQGLRSGFKKLPTAYEWIRYTVIILWVTSVVIFSIFLIAGTMQIVAIVASLSGMDIKTDLLNFLGLAVCGIILGIAGLSINSHIHIKCRNEKASVPLTKLLRHFLFFRGLDMPLDSDTETKNGRGKIGVLRHENGKLYSPKGIADALKDFLETIATIFILTIGVLIWLIILLDFLVSIFLELAANKSVCLAIGVIVGFSTDWLLCPHGASREVSLNWLIGCSILSGIVGWSLWALKNSLEEMSAPALKSVGTTT
jgi:hypothetical protein